MIEVISSTLDTIILRFGLVAIVDIAIVTIALYWIFLIISGTTAMTVLRGAGLFFLIMFVISKIFDLTVLNWLLSKSVGGLVLGLVVLFQTEIRKVFERVGRTGLHSVLRVADRKLVIDQVIKTSFVLSKAQVGALIVLERETGLEDVTDTGIYIQSKITNELLGSIFAANSPLHDGAVIIHGESIVAAGCTLPLTASTLSEGFGMRHRAAVGITETTDAVVLVVSEQRGMVSLVSDGKVFPSTEEKALLKQLYYLFDITLDEFAAIKDNEVQNGN